MAFSDAVTDDLNTFFNDEEHAASVTYGTTEITAIVDYGDSGSNKEYNQDFKAGKAILKVKVSDVTEPAYRDEVTIGSDTWYVRRILDGDGYWWVVGIEKVERPELA